MKLHLRLTLIVCLLSGHLPHAKADSAGCGGPIAPPPFSVVTVPNPKSKEGVMAIVPTKSDTPARAASLAAFAGRPFRKNSTWRAMQVFVFADNKSAQRFKVYQVKRRNQSLRSVDLTCSPK
jgi:hypothetical protein